MSPARTFLVVPVKPSVGGKQRLAAQLPDPARRLLSRALSARIINCIAEVWPGGQAVVVGGDSEVWAHCAKSGIATLADAGAGQSAAVRAGQRWCLERGATSLATVAADLPRVGPEDLRLVLELAERLPERSLALFPDREGTGTNGLVLSPADLDPFHFGPGSLRAHREWASGLGVRFQVVAVPGLAWDVDRPADLVADPAGEGAPPHPVLEWALELAARSDAPGAGPDEDGD